MKLKEGWLVNDSGVRSFSKLYMGLKTCHQNKVGFTYVLTCGGHGTRGA